MPCKYKVFFLSLHAGKNLGTNFMKLDCYFAETNVLTLGYLRETFRGLQSWTETFQRGVPILLQAQFFELKASIQAKLDLMMSQALCKQRVCTFGRNTSTLKAVFCLVLKELRKCMLNDSVEPHGKHRRCASSVLSN